MNSVGLVDVGSYTISLSVSDSLLPVTSSFTLTITNERHKLVSATLPSFTARQNIQTPMDLSSYFIDDDGDPMTLTATYSFNEGIAKPILEGEIFT